MAKEFHRSERVADAIQRSLARLIPQEVRDPRLGMVNINEVVVTRDLAYAKVYVTLVGEQSDEACETSVSILNNAANFLRSLVGKELTMRTTPRLQFYYDKTAVRGQELSSLIDRAVASDKAANAGNDEPEQDRD
jgi:ribosome-binding factor A